VPLDLSPADLCIPTLRPKPFTAEGWLFELKHDGFRAFVRRQGPDLERLSRNGLAMAPSFPNIAARIASKLDQSLNITSLTKEPVWTSSNDLARS
jgi:ATP-dependent DNA ligase